MQDDPKKLDECCDEIAGIIFYHNSDRSRRDRLANALRRLVVEDVRPPSGGPRFFIDHGMIHDSVTGRHVTTAPDDEKWNGGTISDCLALLNELAAHGWVGPRVRMTEAEFRKKLAVEKKWADSWILARAAFRLAGGEFIEDSDS